MYKTLNLVFIAFAICGCTTGPIPEGNGTTDNIRLVGTDTLIVGDCNVVLHMTNSNNNNISNSPSCENKRKKTAIDNEYCERQSRIGYMYAYPGGILTLPLFPFFALANYISKESAEIEAGEVYTRCMEARGHIMNGYGAHTFENGNTYKGYWKNGVFNGQGIFRWKDGGSYDGEWKDGKKNGNGFDIYDDGSTYKGEFENGVSNGYGVRTWPDGDRFEGIFRDDRPNGRGVFTTSDGGRYEGNWSNGCFKDGDRWAAVNQNEANCKSAL